MVAVSSLDESGHTPSISLTMSGGGLTWTQQASSTGNIFYTTQLWTAPVTTGASMTLTFSDPDNTSNHIIETAVFAYT